MTSQLVCEKFESTLEALNARCSGWGTTSGIVDGENGGVQGHLDDKRRAQPAFEGLLAFLLGRASFGRYLDDFRE